MGDHLRAAGAERRRAPRDDLLSRLVLAEDEGGRLSEDELVASCVHLLTAGHETVVNLIAKGTLALLRDPAAAARAASGAVPLERVVEELLRLDAPVQLVSRWALEDLRLGGVDVRRGDGVMLALGAANRDPSVFTRPDVIDFDRAPARHATFGLGIHYCLGAALAKMEGEVAFEVLLSRLPGMRWEEQALSYRESVVFHGLERLEVAF
jgi:cytochrome P450